MAFHFCRRSETASPDIINFKYYTKFYFILFFFAFNFERNCSLEGMCDAISVSDYLYRGETFGKFRIYIFCAKEAQELSQHGHFEVASNGKEGISTHQRVFKDES